MGREQRVLGAAKKKYVAFYLNLPPPNKTDVHAYMAAIISFVVRGLHVES